MVICIVNTDKESILVLQDASSVSHKRPRSLKRQGSITVIMNSVCSKCLNRKSQNSQLCSNSARSTATMLHNARSAQLRSPSLDLQHISAVSPQCPDGEDVPAKEGQLTRQAVHT